MSDQAQDESILDMKTASSVPATVDGGDSSLAAVGGDMMQRRCKLIFDYHGGCNGIVDKLKRTDRATLEGVLTMLVEEMLKEGDHLLGNELIASEDGLLQLSTVISTKRADVLEKAIKAVQQKQIFERQHGIDLDSPSMGAVFDYFMDKVQTTFDELGYDEEIRSVFWKALVDNMRPWKKELKKDLEQLGVD